MIDELIWCLRGFLVVPIRAFSGSDEMREERDGPSLTVLKYRGRCFRSWHCEVPDDRFGDLKIVWVGWNRHEEQTRSKSRRPLWLDRRTELCWA